MQDALFKTINDDGVEHAGYMSFMVLLCFFPFLVFFVALTGFLGASELGQYFIDILRNHLPEHVTEVLMPRVREIVSAPPQGLLTLAIVGTIWTASSFVEGLRTILNRINEVSTPPAYLWRRLLSITQFLIMSVVLTLLMLVLVVFPIILHKSSLYEEFINRFGAILQYGRYGLIFFILLAWTTMFYYFIPNVKVKFRNVLPGAFIVVLLWLITGLIVSNYIVYYKQLSVIYGSLGSIIVTLLFFFVVNMIFIYGAEFNYLYSKINKESRQ
jgi:membrane protein